MKNFVIGQRQPQGQVTCKAGWGDASSFAKETFISFCPLIRFLADFNASGEHHKLKLIKEKKVQWCRR
jgi:hypothetical protein